VTAAVESRGLQEILAAERAVDSVAGIARVALSQHDPPLECPHYLAALERALAEEYPPFGTEEYAKVYRSASADPQWLAESLATNSSGEGDGARRLWSLAFCATDTRHKELIKRHAVDESRHSLAYLVLLDLCFPGAVEPAFRAELNGLSPHFSMANELFAVEGSAYARTPTVDDFIQMNISEMRTTIHHTLQREAIAVHCPDQNRERATAVLDSLLRDEVHHVAYTAELIEEKAAVSDRERFQALFSRRVRDFNRMTREELGQLKFE